MASRISRAVEGWHQRRPSTAGRGSPKPRRSWKASNSGPCGPRRGGCGGSWTGCCRRRMRGCRFPRCSSGLPQMPLGTDWSWRPDLWRGALLEPGAVASGDRTALGDGVALYHDCPLGEVVVRQVRNDKPEDRAPYGLAIDVFGFKGSFLSLALNLPDAAVQGLKSRHLVRVEMVIDSDGPVRAYTRLNIKHGPNLAQPVSSLPRGRSRQGGRVRPGLCRPERQADRAGLGRPDPERCRDDPDRDPRRGGQSPTARRAVRDAG